MMFARIVSLLVLLLAFSSCQKINNGVNNLKLRCGEGLQESDSTKVTQILDPDGNVLAGADLEVWTEALDRNGQLQTSKPLTEKACLEFSAFREASSVVIRSANPSKNWAKRLAYSEHPAAETRLELIDKQGLLAKCATDIVTSGAFVLPLTDLGAGRGLASLDLTLLGDEQDEKLSDGASLVSDGRDAVFFIPHSIPDGSHQIRVVLQDLLRPRTAQPKPFLCTVTVDRAKPIVSTSLDFATDQPPLRVRPGQLISLRSQDLSQSTIHYCRQRMASSTCDAAAEFVLADTEVSFNAEDGGDWELYFFAEDRAKNRSELRKISYTIFKFDRLEALRAASREAILIGKDDPFQGSLAALDLTPIYDQSSSLERVYAAPALTHALIQTLAKTHIYRQLPAAGELLAIKAVHGGANAILSRSELMLIDSRGRETPKTLVKFASQAAVIGMSLNPSGSRMAVIQYTSPRGHRPTELSIVLQTFKCLDSHCVPSGELLENRSRSSCTISANAVWSDDGKLLAYSRCGQLSLFAMDQDEGFAKPLFETASEALMLRIAPNNNILAYYGESTISIWSLTEQRFLNAKVDTGELAESWLECNPLDMQFIELQSITHLLIANDDGFKIWPNQSGCRSNVAWPKSRRLVADARIQSTPQSLSFHFDGYLAAYNTAEIIAAGLQANQGDGASADLEALPRLYVNDLSRDTRQWTYSESSHQFSILTSSALTVFRADTANALAKEAVADFSMTFSQTAAGRFLIDNSAVGAWVIGLAKPWALAFVSEQAALPQLRASEAVAFRWGHAGQLRVGDQNGQLFQLDVEQSAPAVKQIRLQGEIRQIAPYKDGQELVMTEAGELLLLDDATPTVIATQTARRFYESLVVDPSSASFITQARKTIELWKGFDSKPLLLVDNIGFSNDPLYRKLQLIFHRGAYAVGVLIGRFDPETAVTRQELHFFDFEGHAIEIAGQKSFPASAFAVSPDGTMLALIHEEQSPFQQSISWIDLKSDSIVSMTSSAADELAFTGASANLWLEFSPDSSKLAVSGYSGRIAVYSAKKADGFKLIADRKSPFVTRPLLAFLSDSMQLAFVENNNTLVLSDATLELKNVLVFKELIAMLSASPVGNSIAVSLSNQTLILPLDFVQLRSMGCEFLKPELQARPSAESYEVVCPP